MNASRSWESNGDLLVDGVAFVPSPPGAGRFRSSPTRFCLVKRPDLIEQHLKMAQKMNWAPTSGFQNCSWNVGVNLYPSAVVTAGLSCAEAAEARASTMASAESVFNMSY